MKKLIISIVIILTTGCSATQNITPIEIKQNKMCIVENSQVRNGVFNTIKERLNYHNITPQRVGGAYTLKDRVWTPTFIPSEIKQSNCDSILFYVANWSWDLATYMYFANIWVTDDTGKNIIGKATYDASSVVSPNKFITASDKINELMDGLVN